jgi:hypothetical protein
MGGEICDVKGDRSWFGRECRELMGLAPGFEVRPIGPVGAEGGGCLGRPDEVLGPLHQCCHLCGQWQHGELGHRQDLQEKRMKL